MADGWIKAFDMGAVATEAAASSVRAPTRAAPAPTIRAAAVAVPAVARAPRNDLRLQSVWFPIGVCSASAMMQCSVTGHTLERDDFSSNRHLALCYCWSMIFSENR